MIGHSRSPELVGREDERAKIAALLASVRRGISGVLVLRGGPGVGKTVLLQDTVDDADDFTTVRFVAVESEMQLGFAALHALLASFLDRLDELPAPQQRALSAVLGMTDDGAPEPFLVGLATLTLLSAVADRRQLLIVVDDAQWLDQESTDVIAFVARRLYADNIGVLIALRAATDAHTSFDDLPRIDIAPLSDEASRQLLEVASPGPTAAHVEDRLVAEAGGNPLALVELARELSSDQRAGVAVLPETFHVDQRLEARFLRQVAALPADSQRLLLAVAAEPTGDISLILRAGRQLDFDATALDAAAATDVVTVGRTVGFRHPIIRSAVYQAASGHERRRVHRALADATDVDRDPDRRAWHRAAATALPDEDVAEELERAANRAQSRGGNAATSALYERAAELTPERDGRAVRLLVAASAALSAGNQRRSHELVARAIDDLDDAVLVAQARRLQAASMFLNFLPDSEEGVISAPKGDEIMSIMLDAVQALAPLDIHLARETMLDALPMAVYFSGLATPTVRAVASVGLSLPLPPDVEATSADLVLDSLATVFVHGTAAAVSSLRPCLEAVRSDPGVRDLPRVMALGCWVAFALGDDAAVHELARELVESCRESGTYQILPEALNYLGQSDLRRASLATAETYFAEALEIEALLGRGGVPLVSLLLVAAWRGNEAEVRSAAAQLSRQGTGRNGQMMFAWIEHALLILELGLGDYAAAALRRPGIPANELAFGPLKAADEIEAHVRGGDHDVAATRLAWLSERAMATQSSVERGLLSRCRALVADDDTAEAEYQESIEHLRAADVPLHLARTRLVYGEWLRRRKRRRDARQQLDSALDTFEATGAKAFADRARVELLATGATARRRVDETRNDLTPQEEQIARLATAGLTNPEIAGRLFISSSTVDYHLRKVYRKLGIGSRRELGSAASVEV